MARMAGKVALITGAGSGLGAADARRLSAEGARIVVTDINEEQGRSVVAELDNALFLPLDVRDEGMWKGVIARTVEHFGRLDVLVNNAGVCKFGSVEDASLEDFRLHMSVMAEGTFLGCKHAIPAMAQSGGGSIINISSIAAIKGLPVVIGYCAAKSAIVSITQCVAVHCQEQRNGIRCNAVLPGSHDTPMLAVSLVSEVKEESSFGHVGRFGMGQPEDVANLVLFLASDESRHMNGSTLVIDNAESAR